MNLRFDEYVTLGAMAYWLVLAAVRRPRRGWLVLLFSLVTSVTIISLGALPQSRFISALRGWLPALYVLVIYWISGAFFVAPMRAPSATLEAFDRRVLAWTPRFLAGAPRGLLEYLEFSYLACTVMVPGGFLLIVLAGASAGAEYYWSLVVMAEFGSFGALPWIQTLPPRAIEPPGPMDTRRVLMRRINALVMRYGTIHVNTIPSGHAAGAVAIAIAVWHLVPAAGPPLAIMAASIITGSVLGRYHYTLDAITGVAVALLAWLVVTMAGL